jgi:hypothetical protein
MRAIKLSCALVLLLEALLIAAFFAGYVWWGGWRAGLLCSAFLLVLVCLPWLGDLELDYDSGSGRLRVVIGWWGRVTSEGRSATPQLRVLGVTFRSRRVKPAPSKPASVPELPSPPATPRLQKARETAGWAGENLDSVIRLFLAALQAGHELLWGAKELQVRVQSPVQTDWADQALASIIGERQVGPVDLHCTASGKRRIRVHYRTGMLNAGLLGLALVADGRPRRLIADWKRELGGSVPPPQGA